MTYVLTLIGSHSTFNFTLGDVRQFYLSRRGVTQVLWLPSATEKTKQTGQPVACLTHMTMLPMICTSAPLFLDPELQKRMAARQRERVAAKKQQATSAKNKRMAFMQKLEANSPAST